MVAAVTFGILELKAESDYDKAIPGSAASDDIANKGRTLRAADQRRHRDWRRSGWWRPASPATRWCCGSSEKPKTTAFIFTPTAGPSGGGGALTVRF